MKKRGSCLFKKKCLVSLLFLYGSVLSSIVLAHGGDEPTFRIEEVLTKASLEVIFIASVIIIACTGMAMLYEKKWKNHKQLLFLGIMIPTIIATLVLVGSTLYVNVISETKGPVHWHADFEIWVCGEKVDILDPKGLSNRIGTSVFHEHNDNRVHVEGVVVDKKDVSLDEFFHQPDHPHLDAIESMKSLSPDEQMKWYQGF